MKSRKSCNRTPGWVSRKAAKVLCSIRIWGGYLRPGVEFSRVTPFLWKWMEVHHISWKWGEFTPFSAPWGGNGARAAPGWKHQRNLCVSCAFLGIPGTGKCVSGWIFTKNAVSGVFLVKPPKWVESRGIPQFHQICNFWAFPAARGPKRAWGLHVL